MENQNRGNRNKRKDPSSVNSISRCGSITTGPCQAEGHPQEEVGTPLRHADQWEAWASATRRASAVGKYRAGARRSSAGKRLLAAEAGCPHRGACWAWAAGSLLAVGCRRQRVGTAVGKEDHGHRELEKQEQIRC